MLIPGEPEQLVPLQEKLKSMFGESAVIFTSKPYFLEVLPPNCGKGEAIKWLASRLDIPVECTMGFGDSMNDENMIRECGYGVVMKNGLEQMKKSPPLSLTKPMTKAVWATLLRSTFCKNIVECLRNFHF